MNGVDPCQTMMMRFLFGRRVLFIRGRRVRRIEKIRKSRAFEGKVKSSVSIFPFNEIPEKIEFVTRD